MQSSQTFSVVIPTYARPHQLQTCLDALTRLQYPAELFEVIVVDDGSPNPPKTMIQKYERRGNFRLIEQVHGGPAAARNYGALQAMNEYVVFTDDDCVPMPDWLETLANRFRISPDHAIGGKTLNGLPANPYSSASQLLTDYIYSYYNSEEPGQSHLLASNNLAFPRNQFLQLGGFNIKFPHAAAEDRELCTRWVRHGFFLTYAPEVQVEHRHQLTFAKFCKQHFNYGRGAYWYHFLVAQSSNAPAKVKIEPTSFYKNLLRFPFHKQVHGSPVLLAALMAFSQAANAAGYFWERILDAAFFKERRRPRRH